MLTLDQISVQFPPELQQRNPHGMLVEYLQVELLDSLFKDSAAAALSFIGGTAIRILHNSPRFSEDLDFDNFELNFDNRFGAYRRILAAPVRILLAQKLLAILYRRREMGRDVYDASFLMGLALPDFDYIQKTVGLDETQFLQAFEQKLKKLDLPMLARDVAPFLFTPQQTERVITFRDYWLNNRSAPR